MTVTTNTGIARYQKIDKLGEGQFGVVFRAKDTQTNTIVALKRIRLNNVDEGIPSTAIREIALLKELRHENIVRMLDVVPGERKLTIVFECCDMDLQNFIERNGGPLDAPTVKDLMLQLLKSIEYCHFRMVLHRDLKPQNLLISHNKHLKLADFGLARGFEIPLSSMTHEVVTLWYRPPDVLLGSTAYGTGIDMWSIGCIFAEMAIGKPLWAGRTDAEQLRRIFGMLGRPDEDEWPSVNDYPNTAALLSSDEFTGSFPNRFEENCRRLGLYDRIGDVGVDLLRQLLQFEPSRRISAADALKHPYFEQQQQKQRRGASPPNSIL
jgi:cyclin-dependent kinase